MDLQKAHRSCFHVAIRGKSYTLDCRSKSSYGIETTYLSTLTSIRNTIVRWLTNYMTIFFYLIIIWGGKVSAKVQSIRMFLLCWVLRRKNALMWNDMYYRYVPKGTITSFQSVISASNYASCIVGGIPKEGKLHKNLALRKKFVKASHEKRYIYQP